MGARAPHGGDEVKSSICEVRGQGKLRVSGSLEVSVGIQWLRIYGCEAQEKDMSLRWRSEVMHWGKPRLREE